MQKDLLEHSTTSFILENKNLDQENFYKKHNLWETGFSSLITRPSKIWHVHIWDMSSELEYCLPKLATTTELQTFPSITIKHFFSSHD